MVILRVFEMLVLLYGMPRELREYFGLRLGADCCSSVHFCLDGNSHDMPNNAIFLSLLRVCVFVLFLGVSMDMSMVVLGGE
jgi:hypothetical protein